LFHLEKDRGELNDRSGDTAYSAELRAWRGLMIRHFEERGAPFLKGGGLAPRPERLTYSPNYPKPSAGVSL
jgi:hypothetical protein